MTTLTLISYDPTESRLQREVKSTIIHAHAAKVSYEIKVANAAKYRTRLAKSVQKLCQEDETLEEVLARKKKDQYVSYSATTLQRVSTQALIRYASTSMSTHIGNTRRDPFACYPFVLQDEEHILVDYFAQILPYRFYGFQKPRSRALGLNFFQDVVFPIALRHPVSFRCFVLAISAVHRADIANVSTSPELEYQQFWSLRMLRMHFLDHPNDSSDTAIAMCLFRGVFESTPGYEEYHNCLTHMQQVARLVQMRGGPTSLQHDPQLLLAINVYNYVSHDVDDWASMVFFDSTIHTKLWESSQAFVGQAQVEARLMCEDFLEFIRKVTLLSAVQASPEFHNMAPSRHSIFLPNSYIVNLLSSWEASSFSEWETTRKSFVWTRNQQVYGMSLLLHLNAALWDFRNDVAQTKDFLHHFHERMMDLKHDKNYSIEAAAHALLFPPSDMTLLQSYFDRLWFVGKLLKIAKRLDFDCWCKLRRILFANLTFSSFPDDLTWEQDFRMVALSTPSKSWIAKAVLRSIG